MPTAPEPDLELQIAHVLLIDIVGYSKLLVNSQAELLEELNRIVRNAPHFRSAEATGKLMRVPTGDGMALLFFDSPEAPVLCALEISSALKQQPLMELRMGAHSGPIKEVKDVNDRTNFAGAGINMAQRVLDCGDAGHILLSERLADDLRSYRHWHAHLQDLGECEVKHGVRLHLYNVCKDGLGNPALPAKLAEQKHVARHSLAEWWTTATPWKTIRAVVAVSLILSALGGAGYTVLQKRAVDFAAAERARAAVPGEAPEKSVAILPFGNLSEEQNNSYFVQGVQEEILTALARIRGLKVISRTSVMQYSPNGQRNLREIAKALNVAYILEGNVQRIGNRVRVHAQLIDARTDAHVWADRYDRQIADVFAIQSEIAAQIAEQLRATLSPEEKAALEDRATEDMVAYDLYVRAKWSIEASRLSSKGREELTEALQLLDQAVLRDANFFSAYYQLAHTHDQLYLRFDRTPARLAQAAGAIEHMQRLRPNAGETHLARAKHLYWGYLDYESARRELLLARSSLPNDPLVPLLSGYIDRRQGRWDTALENLNRALELDPRNAYILNQISLAYFSLRRFPEMAHTRDKIVELSPSDVVVHVQRAAVELEWRADTKPMHEAIDAALKTNPASVVELADRWLSLALSERDNAAAAQALAHLGSEGCDTEGVPFPHSWCEGVVARLGGDEEAARGAFERTLQAAEQAVAEQPRFSGAICLLGMAHAALGHKTEAIREGRRAVEILPIEKDAVDGALMAEYLAVIYAWTGEKGFAIEQLKTVTTVPGYLSYGYLKLHPYWDPLRGDARFEQIVASLAPK